MASHKTESVDAERKEPLEPLASNAISVAEGTAEHSQLEQPFGVYSVIGMSYSLSATPMAIGTYLVFTVGVGGSPFFLYCFILTFVFNVISTLSLAELASIYPHASGQIFLAYSTMPKKYARACAYWTGCFAIMGWVFATTGTLLFAANLTLGIVSICKESYTAATYHIFLLGIAPALLALLLNIPLYGLLPRITKTLMWIVNAGTMFIFFALLIRTNPKQSVQGVFVDIINETGWGSDGMVFFLGLLPGLGSTGVLDAALHMAEEVPRPDRQIPQVMIGTVFLCGISGLIMTIVYLFCLVNPGNLLTPIGGQPIYQLLSDSYDSLALTVISALFYAVIYFFDVPILVTGLSRIVWTTARSGGMPFSNWLSEVDERRHLPVNSIIAMVVTSVLLSLLQFGPSAIIGNMYSASIMSLFTSYTLPLVGVIIGRWKAIPNTHYFNLGRAGPVLNVISVCWMVVAIVFCAFPTFVPVDAGSMNYAVVIVGVGVSIFGVNWIFYARKNYTAPRQLFVQGIHGPSDGLKSDGEVGV
ncbi:putative amino acid transporter [Ilyonectria sp. MPI-CAGE-AT-0026]|nr:putative amino acid transporter [Ilyonectria sp. MPI-CAGE-AT-0026]